MSELPAAKKSLGQHWLTDAGALRAMGDAAEITRDDTVLEIGPGTGTLTELLVQRAKRVVAVEFDPKLAVSLSAQVEASNLMVVQQDILSFDLTALPPDYKAVANIPYYLTSKLIRNLSETPNRAITVVLLVQKEVARRVAAEPGQMSLLSVSAQYYWQVSLGRIVSANLFIPSPKVDSQILILKRHRQPLFPDADAKQFFRIVKAGFSARRKTLLNSLSAGLRIDRNQTTKLLAQVTLSPELRAQTLSLNDWYALYRALSDSLVV